MTRKKVDNENGLEETDLGMKDRRKPGDDMGDEALERAYQEIDKWRDAVELAYGLLWSDSANRTWLKKRAQKVLLDALREGHDGLPVPGQKAGIEAARELMELEGTWEKHQAQLYHSMMNGEFDPFIGLASTPESGKDPERW